MEKDKRRPIVAGNWKMHLTRPQAGDLIKQLRPLVAQAGCEVVLCAPFTALDAAVKALKGSEIRLGAQNCHWAESGAFTGEISAVMLAEIGVEYVIVGHSERRQYFGETDQTVNARARAALSAGLTPIVCVGETLEQREAGETLELLHRQLTAALDGVPERRLTRLVLAYEPVWAIGTGRTASAQEAGEACAFLRGMIAGLYGEAAAELLRIQYGGSMNAHNAASLLAQQDIDGGLIGGASLKAADLAAIVAAAG
jgi:triosephosphate isomerase